MERAVYRIIDANFNRAREAARVVEDYCRFALNSGSLTARAKQLRHELSAAMIRLDAGRLVASRDTTGDVGIGTTVEVQLKRRDLVDSFTAACKRLTEALRVLAEMAQPIDRAVANTIENLRYAAYTLEKDIVVFSEPAGKFARVKLYVLISSSLPTDVLTLAHQCVAGGADCIQLRAKEINDDEFFGLGCEIVKICRDAGVLSIINDRADIAVAAGADGVHLGQNDMPVEQVRRLASSPIVIGKSTHTAEQVRAACAEMPSYVSLGPVFATATKPSAEPVGLEYIRSGLEILEGTGIGSVAVGGITIDNIETVLKAGAKVIAVCSAVTAAINPTDACRQLKNKLNAFLS
jgi:thiamine-phosphate pyrophosphorylase